MSDKHFRSVTEATTLFSSEIGLDGRKSKKKSSEEKHEKEKRDRVCQRESIPPWFKEKKYKKGSIPDLDPDFSPLHHNEIAPSLLS